MGIVSGCLFPPITFDSNSISAKKENIKKYTLRCKTIFPLIFLPNTIQLSIIVLYIFKPLTLHTLLFG